MALRFLLFLILLGPTTSTASPTLKVGIPTDQAPHIFISDNKLMGPEGLALDAALRASGFNPHYEYFPSLRVIERLKNGFIDATINVQDELLPFAFASSFSYGFENCAASKASKNLTLQSIEDLSGHDIVAFKNAKTSLDPQTMSQVIHHAKTYQEIQSVETRIKMINADRADVMLTEKEIFLFYLKNSKLGNPNDYKLHCFFKPNNYHLFFRDRTHLQQFDKGKKKAP